MTVQRSNLRDLLPAALAALLLAGALLLVCTPVWASAAPETGATSMAGDASLSAVEARRLRFLFWGYAAIWLLLGGYIVSLGWRLRTVRAEIGRLRDRLAAPRSRDGAA